MSCYTSFRTDSTRLSALYGRSRWFLTRVRPIQVKFDRLWQNPTRGALRVLTDVVILSAGAELEAQRERREELELLGELQRSVRRQGPVALPALEALGGVVARAVAVVVHHVEHVALGPVVGHRAGVVRTVHIEVVVDADVDVVISPVKSGGNKRTGHF